MSFEKPDKIKRAIKSEDVEYLKAAGRKGAEVTNAKKQKELEEEQLRAEILAEKKAYEERERAVSANEHIITAEGEDLDFSDEV